MDDFGVNGIWASVNILKQPIDFPFKKELFL